ncbi:TPR-like protein [Basidiobolus meristosporus CBS 931.73]|uniref:TPR-like protein n=1 Tax=Basidiobolus meristosporus CBS 931.73 TaxID=1314790 RepID=A0A1Y1Y564_9FUNG|nr:TPR-like protein [Basidiobolus meristosporus CBS 931.73]|eukprot:ORX93160.1 TPR-like protein [Basidiobolus meristosporus CBS 931.73]
MNSILSKLALPLRYPSIGGTPASALAHNLSKLNLARTGSLVNFRAFQYAANVVFNANIQNPEGLNWKEDLRSAIDNHHFRDAWTLYQDHGVDGKGGFSSEDYDVLLQYFDKRKSQQVFEDIAKSGLEYTEENYSHLFKNILKYKDNKGALELWERLKNDSKVKPTLTHYNIVMGAICKSTNNISQLDAMYAQLLADGYEPDDNTFGVLVTSRLEANKVEEAKGLLVEMEKRGIKTGPVAHNVFISRYVYHDDMQSALKMFDRLTASGIKPSIRTFNSLLNGYVKQNDITSMEKIFNEDLKKYEVSPDVVTINILIKGYMQNGDLDSAMKVYNSLPELGLRPATATFNTLITGFGNAQEMAKVKEIFSQMRKSRTRPNIQTFTNLITQFGRYGNLNQAIHYYQDLEKYNLTPDEAVFTSLIQTCYTLQKPEMAKKVIFEQLNSLGKCTSQTLGMMVDTYTESGRLEDAKKAVEEVKSYVPADQWASLREVVAKKLAKPSEQPASE